MRPQHIMFAGFIFMAGTLISLTFAGGWFDTTDVDTLNSIAAFRQASVLNLWSVQVPNIDFVLTGLGALIKMDFAFFGGGMEILRWFFLFTISAGLVFGLFTVMIVTVTSFWGRR